MEIEEVKELKKAKDKTSHIRLRLADFSIPLLPSLARFHLTSASPELSLFGRKVLAARLAGSLALIGAALVFSPRGIAQTNTQANKPSESEKSKEAPAILSHDLSGVWMQYRDGDVPGTPGMNGVNEHFRPPLTPWGQAKFESAQALRRTARLAAQS